MLRDLIMKRTFYFTFCCVLTLGIVFKSCKKDDDTDPEEVVEQQFIDWGDVYFIGYRMDEYLGAPNYYKNNIAYPLEVNGDTKVYPADIAVSDGDVYVVGTENMEAGLVPKVVIWKNGKRSELPIPESKEAQATSVFIKGKDVFVTGLYVPKNLERGVGVVWKNGEPIFKTDGKRTTRFKEVIVVGDDVYAVGHEHLPEGGIVSKYWKNGKAVKMSDPDIVTYTTSIAVDGSDIYVLGYIDELSKTNRSLTLWKNQQPQHLISSRSVIRGGQVVFENGSVYACGYEQVGSKYEPRLFKDGVIQHLEDNNSNHTYTSDLKVYQDNALVLGRMYGENTLTKSVLWVNGKAVDLVGFENNIFLTEFDVAPY
jgi:hypothetical protein